MVFDLTFRIRRTLSSTDIGVDIEHLREIPDCEDIAANCFSIYERKQFRSLRDCDRMQGFFNCWTRKEAFVKSFGEGLNYPLDSFDVSLRPGESPEILDVRNDSEAGCNWEVYSFCPELGFVGAVVLKNSV